ELGLQLVGQVTRRIVSRREADPELQAAFGRCIDDEDGVVGVGDRLDDGEAEAEPARVAGARTVEPLERLEDPLELAGGDPRPGVRDREDGPAVARAGRDLDLAAGAARS